MVKRRCYQCGDESLEDVQERRNEEIRAWAAESQAQADALIGVPQPGTSFFDDDDVRELEVVGPAIPIEEEVEVEEVAAPKRARPKVVKEEKKDAE